MNILKITIFFFLLLFSSICHSQEKEVEDIIFTFNSAMRIPFNNVTIQIFKRADGKSAFAFVNSEPANDDPEWRYSKIDTIYDITIEKFNSFKEKAILLDKIDVDKAFLDGTDGSTCKIEFGAKGRNTSYAYWIPKAETKERGLENFLELCEEIISSMHLNPKEILGD